MELKLEEMTKVNGGVSWEAIATAGGIITLILGIISGYTNPSKCNNQKGEEMKELKKNEMENINGGNVSSAVINAVVNVVNIIFELGEKIGSSINRLLNDTYCPLN